jgi:hypothetical protein
VSRARGGSHNRALPANGKILIVVASQAPVSVHTAAAVLTDEE